MVDTQIIELNAWSELPEFLPYRYFTCDLDEAKRKFKVLTGFDCKVVFKVNRQWLLVTDKDYRLEVQE